MELATLKKKSMLLAMLYKYATEIFGTVMTGVMLFMKSIIVSIMGVSFLNPDAKAMIADVTLIVGLFIGLATFISIIYKIVKTHKEIKKINKR